MGVGPRLGLLVDFCGGTGQCALLCRASFSTMLNSLSAFEVVDAVRCAAGASFAQAAFSAWQVPFTLLRTDRGWRLRDYGELHGGAAWPLLIVSSPIKRAYVWDLGPGASAVERCVAAGLHVYMLEWEPCPGSGAGGLAWHGVEAIDAAVAEVSRRTGRRPVLIGHSLGGLLAAIFAASRPELLRGLVMLATPLCLEGGVSGFRDAFVALAPRAPSADLVPGSFVSTLSVMAAPVTFLGALPLDAAFSMFDFRAGMVHARVQRWLLDEAPVPSALANEVLERLFKENQFCRGELCLDGAAIGPKTLRLPTLAVASPDDVIAPPETIQPFLDRMTAGRVERVLEYPSEIGTGLPHLAILVGRWAPAEVWKEIFRWMNG